MIIKNIYDKEQQNIPLKNYKTYFSLLFEKIEKLGITEDKFLAIDPLMDKLRLNDVEMIKHYFKKILSQKYCEKCLKIYSDNFNGTKCLIEKCNGKIITFNHLLKDEDEIFKLFYRLHRYPTFILKEYSKRSEQITNKISEIGDQINNIESKKLDNEEDDFFSANKIKLSEKDAQKLEDLKKKREEYNRELLSLLKLKESLKRLELKKILERSEYSNLLFNIRNINEQIEIKEAFLEKSSDTLEGYVLSYKNRPTQEIINVLNRYHPYAIVQYGFSKNIVTGLDKDDFKTDKINQSYYYTEITKRKFCDFCNTFINDMDLNNTCFKCGSNLIEILPIYPSRIYIIREDFSISQSKDDVRKFVKPSSLYPLSSKRRHPRKTYCEVHYHLEENDFKPIYKLVIPSKIKKDQILELIFGNLKVYNYADSFKTLYEDNLYDKKERPFKLCSDCFMIWDQGKIENDEIKNRCPKNPEEHLNPIYVRLVSILETEGIKINFNYLDGNLDSVMSHSLSHGLRVSLQKISGVDIREIAEVIDNKNIYYIYDTVQGGNAICESLFKKIDNEFIAFKEAIEIILTLISDKCENGCPLCLYQFNCIEKNNPTTFNKNELKKFLKSLNLDKIELLTYT